MREGLQLKIDHAYDRDEYYVYLIKETAADHPINECNPEYVLVYYKGEDKFDHYPSLLCLRGFRFSFVARDKAKHLLRNEGFILTEDNIVLEQQTPITALHVNQAIKDVRNSC